MVLLPGRHGLRSDVNDDAAVFDSVDNSEVLAAVAIGWGCRGPFHGIARRPIAQWRGPRRTPDCIWGKYSGYGGASRQFVPPQPVQRRITIRPYTKRTQGFSLRVAGSRIPRLWK
jgi:hypothetical protein